MAATRTQSVTNTAPAGTTISATIAAPSANSLIVTAVGIDKNSGAITVPTNFTLLNDYVSDNVSGGFAFKVSDGTETSVAWNWATAQIPSMWVGVYTGLTTTPLDVKAEADSGATSVTSQTTGTTAATSQALELAISVMAADTNLNVDLGRAWTNSFTELVWVTGGGSGDPGMSIAERNLTATGAVETTFSTTDIGDQMWASVAAFKEAAAAPPQRTLMGVGT